MNLEKENTVTIDPTTGLPTLPGGYFWEVYQYMKECRAGAGGESRWMSPAGYAVGIMTTKMYTTEAPKERWWDKPVASSKHEKITVRSARLIDPEKYRKAEEDYDKYKAGETYWSGAIELMFDSTYYEYITPEIVLEAATKLYTEWQSSLEANRVAKERREASKALVGVYPPKALS